MGDATGSSYTDPSGNTYSFITTLSLNGTIIPNGYHFKNTLTTAQFAADVIWLACFTAITVAICCIQHRDKSKQAGTTATHKYLRWPVIGASVVFIVFIYTMQVYNRIKHELRKPIVWYYPAIIGVSTNVFNGFASGLLIAFILWQLTPVLLLYGNASKRRQKWTILLCRLLTFLISLLNTADTIVTAMIWVLNLQKAFARATNSTENKISSISNINDAALTSAFTGMYLFCILIFAYVALQAIRNLSPSPQHFKPALSLLTLGITGQYPNISDHLRSALDFAWCITFKVFALRPHLNLGSQLMTNLIHTVLYGAFSVIVYVCILFLAMAPLPVGIDHSAVGVEYLPKDKRMWHRRSLRLGRHEVGVGAVGPQDQWKGGARVAVEEVGLSKPGDGMYYGQQEGGYAAWGPNSISSAGDLNGGQKGWRDGVEYQPPVMQGRY